MLIIAHFLGSFIGNLAIVVSSLWAFAYFSFKKELDLYVIFLFLVPSIVLAPYGDDAQGFLGKYLRNFHNVLFIGPLALSVNLFLAFAVPVRLFLNSVKIRFYGLAFLWLTVVLLAIGGLYIAFSSEQTSKSGLTIGIRIALSVGVLLLPLSIKDKTEYYKSLDMIVFISMILFITGLMNGYWGFIIVGFIPYYIKRCKPKIIAFFPIVYAVKLLVTFDSTITIIGTITVSLLFYFFIVKSSLLRSLFQRKYFQFTLIIIPILLTVYTLQLESKKKYDFDTVSGLVHFKLVGDRKPLWDASYKQIVTSSFILVPAGRPLIVYIDWSNKWLQWENGAHNIFLEMGNQIGLICTIFLFTIIIFMLIKSGRVVQERDDLILYYCFLTVYLIFGLTGQALIYDGAGFFYWLLLGQFFRVGFKEINETVN